MLVFEPVTHRGIDDCCLFFPTTSNGVYPVLSSGVDSFSTHVVGSSAKYLSHWFRCSITHGDSPALAKLSWAFYRAMHVMQRTVLLSEFCLSVRHVRCVYGDKTKWWTADILIPHARNGNRSSFLTPTAVGGRCPFPSEICAQSDSPLRPISAHIVSTVGDSEKKFNYDEYKVDHGLSNEL